MAMDHDSEPKSEHELTTQASLFEHDPDQYTGAFFPRARHFVINGGAFTTNVHQSSPRASADIRVIPLGDLNLLREIELDGRLDVVRRGRGQASVRRMYTAQIPGLQSSMTAVLYRGDGAEEQWRQDLSRYSDLRHPYLLQLYGIISSRSLHATIFHDDLIPYTKLEKKYRDSHWSVVFFWACVDGAYSSVNDYIFSLSKKYLHWGEYQVWVRPSTGRLCLDLTPPESGSLSPWVEYMRGDFRPSGISLCEPPQDFETVVTSMSLQDYYAVCAYHLCRWQHFSISTNTAVKVGSARHFPSPNYEDSVEIACLPSRAVYDDGWYPINYAQEGVSIMANGWIRVNSENVVDQYTRTIGTSYSSLSWLAQANDIFDRLDLTSNFKEYGTVNRVKYKLRLWGRGDNLPPGYLFLSPWHELQSDDCSSSFRRQTCPAYWSLDPSGAQRLSLDEAREQGFPLIELEVFATARFWDDNVYAGIHQLHKRKGFHPYNPNIVLLMGLPLFRVCYEWDALSSLRENQTDDGYFSSNSEEVSGAQYYDKFGDDSDQSDDLGRCQWDSYAKSWATTFEEVDMSQPSCDMSKHTVNNVAITGEFLNASRDENAPRLNQDPSEFHSKPFPTMTFCHALDDEMVAPSWSWNIILGVQFSLILILSAFWLYD